MVYYFIMCRSLTYAQKSARTLERAGITGRVVRAPKGISSSGCSYAVKVSEPHLSSGLKLLKQSNLQPKNVYVERVTGTYSEVNV